MNTMPLDTLRQEYVISTDANPLPNLNCSIEAIDDALRLRRTAECFTTSVTSAYAPNTMPAMVPYAPAIADLPWPLFELDWNRLAQACMLRSPAALDKADQYLPNRLPSSADHATEHRSDAAPWQIPFVDHWPSVESVYPVTSKRRAVRARAKETALSSKASRKSATSEAPSQSNRRRHKKKRDTTECSSLGWREQQIAPIDRVPTSTLAKEGNRDNFVNLFPVPVTQYEHGATSTSISITQLQELSQIQSGTSHWTLPSFDALQMPATHDWTHASMSALAFGYLPIESSSTTGTGIVRDTTFDDQSTLADFT